MVTSDVPATEAKVANHYANSGLEQTVLDALTASGKDVAHLSPADLAPVDEFHTGQRGATIRLAELLHLRGSERVVDVGCGIGGPSRFLAKQYGCRVSGLDLTSGFVRVADMLAHLTGLSALVDYRQGDALNMPFADQIFDIVWCQNVSMNVANRPALYAEMFRVLKPDGQLAIQDVVAGSGGPPFYPLSWAREPNISFLSKGIEPSGARSTTMFTPSTSAR